MATIAATGYPWVGSMQALGHGYEQSRFYLSPTDVVLWRFDSATFILWRADLRRLDFVINNRTVAAIGCYLPVQGQYSTNGPIHLLGQLFEVPHVADRFHRYGGWIQYEPLAERMRVGVGAPPATALEIYGNGNICLADLVEDPKGAAEPGLPVSLFSGLLHLSADGRLIVEALYEGYRLFLQGEIGDLAATAALGREASFSGEAEIAGPSAQGSAAWIVEGEGEAEIAAPSADGVATVFRKLISAGDLASCEAEASASKSRRISASAAVGAVESAARLYAEARGVAGLGSTSASGFTDRARSMLGAAGLGSTAGAGRGYRYARASADLGGLSAYGETVIFRLIHAEGAPVITGPTPLAVLGLLRLFLLIAGGDVGPSGGEGRMTRSRTASGSATAREVRSVGFADRHPNAQRQLYRIKEIKRAPGTGVAVAILESTNRPVDR